MVDFNQALTFSDAMQCALALDHEGVYWIEEPTRHDDYRHLARDRINGAGWLKSFFRLMKNIRAPPGDDELCSLGQQGFGDRIADTTRAAGDEHALGL
jgi:hypothetical protein